MEGGIRATRGAADVSATRARRRRTRPDHAYETDSYHEGEEAGNTNRRANPAAMRRAPRSLIHRRANGRHRSAHRMHRRALLDTAECASAHERPAIPRHGCATRGQNRGPEGPALDLMDAALL